MHIVYILFTLHPINRILIVLYTYQNYESNNIFNSKISLPLGPTDFSVIEEFLL